jgi:hypothetical protein
MYSGSGSPIAECEQRKSRRGTRSICKEGNLAKSESMYVLYVHTGGLSPEDERHQRSELQA